jgi:hypothetical protein
MKAMPQVTLPKLSNQDSFQEQKLKILADKRAAADPTPGPLAKAFGPSVTRVGEVEVRKPVASDWPVLRALDSPILKFLEAIRVNQNKGVSEPPNVPTTSEEEGEIFWQFTHTPAQVRELMASGKDKFRNVAVAEVCDVHDDSFVKLVIAIVMQKIAESWATVLQISAELEEKGDVHFFQDSAANLPTASVGGSTP